MHAFNLTRLNFHSIIQEAHGAIRFGDFYYFLPYCQGKDFTFETFRKTAEREVREAGRLVRRRGIHATSLHT